MVRVGGASMSLPIVPPPTYGESLPGYATRLAEANVWDDAASMFKDMGSGSFIRQLKDLDKLKHSIRELTGSPLAKLSMDDEKFSALTYDDSRCFKNIRALAPRVCSKCIDETQVLLDCWQLHGFDICLKHNTPLLSQCPNCKCSFDWHSSLLQNECNHCYFKLGLSSVLGDTPAYLTQLLKYGPKKQKLFLKDLFLCSQRITRPFDSFFEKYERPNQEINWSDILESAYQLLSSKEHFSSWINALYKNRNHLGILGRNAILLPAIELIERLSLDWPISQLSLLDRTIDQTMVIELKELLSSSANLKPSRLLGEPSNISLQSQTDLYGVAIALGLTKGNPVTKAVAYQLILPNNQAKVSRNSIFDLSKISTDFHAIGSITQCSHSGLKSLDQYHSIWPLFNTTDLDILNYIKNGKLPGRVSIDKGSFVESFEPKIFSLFRCLHEQLSKIHGENFSLNQARKILGVSWNDAQVLIEENVLSYTFDERTKLVKGEDILKSLKSWVFLPRICRIHGLNRTTVRLELEKLGITPAIRTNIYNKNLKLMTAINKLKNS
jgi:hypothetical protein